MVFETNQRYLGEPQFFHVQFRKPAPWRARAYTLNFQHQIFRCFRAKMIKTILDIHCKTILIHSYQSLSAISVATLCRNKWSNRALGATREPGLGRLGVRCFSVKYLPKMLWNRSSQVSTETVAAQDPPMVGALFWISCHSWKHQLICPWWLMTITVTF